MKLLKLEKEKPSFVVGLIFIKVNRVFRRGNQKVSEKLCHTHYCFDGHSGIEDWDFVIFELCQTHLQLT